MNMSEITTIKNNKELDDLLKKHNTVVLKATASWCGPCRVLENTLKNLDKTTMNGAIVAEFDVDDAEDVSTKLGVRNIPVLFFFKDGELKDKMVGNVPASNIYGKIKEL